MIPVEVVGTRGTMGQEEQADIMEEPAVVPQLSASSACRGHGRIQWVFLVFSRIRNFFIHYIYI